MTLTVTVHLEMFHMNVYMLAHLIFLPFFTFQKEQNFIDGQNIFLNCFIFDM